VVVLVQHPLLSVALVGTLVRVVVVPGGGIVRHLAGGAADLEGRGRAEVRSADARGQVGPLDVDGEGGEVDRVAVQADHVEAPVVVLPEGHVLPAGVVERD